MTQQGEKDELLKRALTLLLWDVLSTLQHKKSYGSEPGNRSQQGNTREIPQRNEGAFL